MIHNGCPIGYGLTGPGASGSCPLGSESVPVNSLSSLANERAVAVPWGLRVARTKGDSNDVPRDSKTLTKETGLLLVSLSSGLLTLSDRKREADMASDHFLLTRHFFKI